MVVWEFGSSISNGVAVAVAVAGAMQIKVAVVRAEAVVMVVQVLTCGDSLASEAVVVGVACLGAPSAACPWAGQR